MSDWICPQFVRTDLKLLKVERRSTCNVHQDSEEESTWQRIVVDEISDKLKWELSI